MLYQNLVSGCGPDQYISTTEPRDWRQYRLGQAGFEQLDRSILLPCRNLL
jgi:hypothetical protein